MGLCEDSHIIRSSLKLEVILKLKLKLIALNYTVMLNGLDRG